MDSLSYKTQFLNRQTVEREWFVIDATDLTLGRLVSMISLRLRGKHKPSFTPHVDCGDKIIIINAEKVRLTGRKWDQKVFLHHTGYPGGQKAPTYRMVQRKNPARVIEIAVKGMLPKNRLGRVQFGNLYVYAGSSHPHTQQNPKPLTLAL